MAAKRVLVTGATGNLGQDLIARLGLFAAWEVIPTTRRELDLAATSDRIREQLDALNPDIIVNTAGFTAVDAAETALKDAWSANVEGPTALAAWSAQHSAYLIHLSTDYVFDGSKGDAYTVEDLPNPINRYGETKRAGEIAVRGIAPENSAVVRTSWLFGPGERNFVPFVVSAAKAGRAIRVADDQVGTPTWTGNLCKMLIRLLDERPTGIFHGCGTGQVTRYAQALYLCQCLGISPDFMTPVATSDFGFEAQRPMNTSMVSSFSDAMAWQDATDRFFAVNKEAVGV